MLSMFEAGTATGHHSVQCTLKCRNRFRRCLIGGVDAPCAARGLFNGVFRRAVDFTGVRPNGQGYTQRQFEAGAIEFIAADPPAHASGATARTRRASRPGWLLSCE